MRLIETRNFRTGAKQQFIDGKRVSNHEFSETWLKVGAHGHGTIEQTRYGDRHTWETSK
jgi:hypothetical protein